MAPGASDNVKQLEISPCSSGCWNPVSTGVCSSHVHMNMCRLHGCLRLIQWVTPAVDNAYCTEKDLLSEQTLGGPEA